MITLTRPLLSRCTDVDGVWDMYEYYENEDENHEDYENEDYELPLLSRCIDVGGVWDMNEDYENEDYEDYEDEDFDDYDDDNYFECNEYAHNLVKLTKEDKGMGINLKKRNRFGLNLEFGKIETNDLKLSMDGKIAIKNNEGNYVVFDTEENKLTNVADFVLDVQDVFYAVPVQTIQVGDLIKTADGYKYVIEIGSEGNIVLDLQTGKIESILEEANMFGFKFYTKVVTLFDFQSDSEDNEMSKMLPLLMMKDKEGSSSSDLFLMMSLFGQNMGNINPMMLMFLDGDNDALETMMLMQAFQPK